MTFQVAVIGGGLAGLSAAAALAERGLRVCVLESRPRLGGRAGSFPDGETGTTIDNCQHVSLGCCTNFDHFCRLTQLDDLLRTEKSLSFVGPDGQISRFAAGIWPAPFHLLGAFRELKMLRAEHRRQIRRGLQALCRWQETEAASGQGTAAGQGTAEPGEPAGSLPSFADWLQQHGQSPEVIERFWNVVLISALSETPQRTGIAPARKVFVDAFLANRRGWEMRVPVVPLQSLYGERLSGWLERRGTLIRLKAGVDHLTMENGRCTAAVLRSGEEVAARHFVLAVPYERVRSLLPPALSDDPFFAGLSRFESAPISSVHLWFDRCITPLPHAVLVGRLSQWVFNRTALQKDNRCAEQIPAGRKNSEGENAADWYYQVVISASREVQGRGRAEVIATVRRELGEIWPTATTARLQHARLITEHKAVFSPLPGMDRWRPAQQSPLPNLQLAGDWTDTGWPATMESAVRSGYLAAENILRQEGRAECLLQPGLPVSFWSRCLFGL